MLVCKKNREEFLCPDLLPSLFYSKFKLIFCAIADRKRFQSRPVMFKKIVVSSRMVFSSKFKRKNCEGFPPIEPLTAKIAVIAPPPMTISFVLYSFIDICWHWLTLVDVWHHFSVSKTFERKTQHSTVLLPLALKSWFLKSNFYPNFCPFPLFQSIKL